MPLIAPTKLTPMDWMRVAFQKLTNEGVSAVKVEVLAKHLNATKGSFYWHFKDVPSFKVEMLKLWEAEATNNIIVAVTSSTPIASDRLGNLASIVARMNADNAYGGLQAEPAIRQWARVDNQAALAVLKVDAARIAFVRKLFIESGFNYADAKSKAELFYSGFLGLQAMAAIRPMDVGVRLKRLLMVLLKQ